MTSRVLPCCCWILGQRRRRVAQFPPDIRNRTLDVDSQNSAGSALHVHRAGSADSIAEPGGPYAHAGGYVPGHQNPGRLPGRAKPRNWRFSRYHHQCLLETPPSSCRRRILVESRRDGLKLAQRAVLGHRQLTDPGLFQDGRNSPNAIRTTPRAFPSNRLST